MNDWKLIYQAENQLQAHCIKGMLAQSGIEVRLTGEALQGAVGELPFNEIAIGVYVFFTQMTRAKQAIAQFEAKQTKDWSCSDCKELNASTFEICWQCGHDPRS